MGISKVTGIAATALLVTSVSLWKIGLRIVTFPVLATCLVAWIVTFASHTAINLPWILGKNSVGRFPIWSLILFGPFLTLARSYAIVKRFMRKESVYNQIADDLYLGGWPFLMKHLPLGAHLSLIALVSYQEVSLSERMSTFVLLLGIQELQQHIKSN